MIENSEIGNFIKNAPRILTKDTMWSTYKFAIYFMFEKSKGEKSFWHPYFQILPIADLPSFWSESELEFLGNPKLSHAASTFRKMIKNAYDLIKLHIFSCEKMLFGNESIYNEQNFTQCVIQIATRMFGWKLPCDCMIPLIDCANHSPRAETVYGIIDKKLKKDYIHTNSGIPIGMEKGKYDHKIVGMPGKKLESKHKKEYVEISKGVKIEKDSAKKLEKTLNDNTENLWDLDFYSSSCSEDSDAEISESDNDKADEIKEKNSENSNSESEGSEDQEGLDSEDDEKIDKLYNKYLEKIKDPFERKMLSEVSATEKYLVLKQQNSIPIKKPISWWKHDDPNLLFCLASGSSGLKPGDQIFITYGRRSNDHLIL